jgi:hypothetical protein
MLLDVLANDLGSISIPSVLIGLEDAHLINDASEVMVRLARHADVQNVVLEQLLDSLYLEQRRGGAETALVKLGALAVPHVGELLTEPDPYIARSAMRILRDIGAPALSFIWTTYSNTNDALRREAALEVFRNMRTEAIKDELVKLLASDRQSDISMAVALLLERIRDESTQHYADHLMVEELLEYVHTHAGEEINRRIVSLLLLLNEQAIIDPLLKSFDEHPQHRKQLTYVLLLLGEQAQTMLQKVFDQPGIQPELRAELAAVLGMTIVPKTIVEYAQNLSNYGLATTRTSVLFPDQLVVSLRALGALLASGYWDMSRLEQLRDASKEGSPTHELFNVLLGWRYEPQLIKIEAELKAERENYKRELLALTARILEDQNRIHSLENDLEQVRNEDGFRGDELSRLTRENEELHKRVEQVTQERSNLRIQVDNLRKEIKILSESNDQLSRQKTP